MKAFPALIAAIALASTLTACNGGNSNSGMTSPAVPAATSAATSAASSAFTGTLSSGKNSVCVPAQSAPENVTLPDTGGMTATINLNKYDAGGTGCQNVTITTGDAAAAVTASSSARSIQSNGAPLFSITTGDGFDSHLGLVTAVAGVQLKTDPSLNFPDGTYNGTVTYLLLGEPLVISVQFTAQNGVLILTNANALPLLVAGGAVMKVYDRGVIPPGFTLPTPTSSPSASQTATPVPAPTVNPNPNSFGDPPVSGSIGTTTYTESRDCPGGYGPEGGNPCSYTYPIQQNGSGNYTLFMTPGDLAGTVSYSVTGFNALSYAIVGCASPISYAGGGLSGTFSFPNLYGVLTINNSYCAVNLSSAPAGYQGTYYGVTLLLLDGYEPTIPTTQPVIQLNSGMRSDKSFTTTNITQAK